MCVYGFALQWRHNESDGVSNYQPHDCLLKYLSGAILRKHQSSASLAFVRGIHRWPVNSQHKWPVTRKMFPFNDVIMVRKLFQCPNIGSNLNICHFVKYSHQLIYYWQCTPKSVLKGIMHTIFFILHLQNSFTGTAMWLQWYRSNSLYWMWQKWRVPLSHCHRETNNAMGFVDYSWRVRCIPNSSRSLLLGRLRKISKILPVAHWARHLGPWNARHSVRAR